MTSQTRLPARVLLVAIGALCAAWAVALAGPAAARPFPCAEFDEYVAQSRVFAARKLTEPALTAANRALTQTENVVAAQSCREFRYRRVHRWLAREWKPALARRTRARAEGRPYPRILGRLEGLGYGITFVERAAKDHGIFLRPIRNVSDE